EVNDLTRMRLALDIFFSKANKKRDKVVKLAIDYWDNIDQNSTKDGGKSSKKPVVAVTTVTSNSSQSLTI
ncbi:hypothetical protein HN873_060189, partial [Arachis hypogaea]